MAVCGLEKSDIQTENTGINNIDKEMREIYARRAGNDYVS